MLVSRPDRRDLRAQIPPSAPGWQHHPVRGFRIDRTCPRIVPIVRGDDIVVPRCHVAERWSARFVGLLGTTDLTAGEGLWLAPCASVHTWGMRIAIACAFVDEAGRVLRVVDPLPPWRAVACRGAAAVLETGADGMRDVQVGDLLRWGSQGPVRE